MCLWMFPCVFVSIVDSSFQPPPRPPKSFPSCISSPAQAFGALSDDRAKADPDGLWRKRVAVAAAGQPNKHIFFWVKSYCPYTPRRAPAPAPAPAPAGAPRTPSANAAAALASTAATPVSRTVYHVVMVQDMTVVCAAPLELSF